MKLQRTFEHLYDLSEQQVIPRGIVDEGRIFALGRFENGERLHGRTVEVVEGLKEHVGQPFELHPWAFVAELSTFQQDGATTPLNFLEVVLPQMENSVLVKQYLLKQKRRHLIGHLRFDHTSDGTKINMALSNQNPTTNEEQAMTSLYPLAIAVLNTRGCNVDLKRPPSITNTKRKRQGKRPVPAHYDVGVADYFTALQHVGNRSALQGTHASPVPHLRRAHERVLSCGKRIWVRSALVNVRREGDIAFVERRMGYKRREPPFQNDLAPSG